MTNTRDGDSLIEELLADPEGFSRAGKGYQLLESVFDGFPAEALRPLLRHSSQVVRRSAAFVVSELAERGSSLVSDVVPLIRDEDRHTRWYALETVMVCSGLGTAKLFVSVARELETSDRAIRQLAMRLVANGNVAQIEAAIEQREALGVSAETHQRGLKALLTNWDASNAQKMLTAPDALLRRYGVIYLRRRYPQSATMLERACKNEDADVREFASDDHPLTQPKGGG